MLTAFFLYSQTVILFSCLGACFITLIGGLLCKALFPSKERTSCSTKCQVTFFIIHLMYDEIHYMSLGKLKPVC